MHSSKTNLAVGLLIVLAAIGWGIYRFRPASRPSVPAPAATNPEAVEGMRSDRNQFVPPDDPALMNQVFDLESRLAEIDKTVWKGEMLSHRYGDVFVNLWDKLRSSPDPFKALADFPFGELTLAEEESHSAHEWGITVVTTGANPRTLTPEQWRQQLSDWKVAGYQLDNSEWRHTRFDPPTNNLPAQSVMLVTLFILHPVKQDRITLQGELQVTWTEPADPAGAPRPARIDASHLAITRRVGPPMFEHLASKVVMPFTNLIFISPLMLYDLNGDGLSEIMLGCRNQVYWNRGGGKFEVGTLCRYRPQQPYTMTLGDFDGDGHVDLLVADVVGVELYTGNALGQFNEPGRPVWTAKERLGNPFVFASGDIDGDGDLDVWLAQYQVPYAAGQMPTPYYDANDGFPSFLLLNNGRGDFTDATESSGLGAKRNRRAYSCSFIDLDEDGDLDFVQVSDFAGLDLFLNDGHGHFTDATTTHIDEPHSLGMGHTIGDFDLDGRMDLYVIGMISYAAQRMDHLGEGPAEFANHQKMRPIATYGNRMYFARDGQWVHTPMSDQVARTGWSWGRPMAISITMAIPTSL